jgi:multidrug resistance efflux pump
LNDEKDHQSPAETATDTDESQAQSAADTTKRGGQVVVGLIVLSLLWYLLADRFTPVTDQARVQGYVVGVAPQVGGVVTEVWVHDNQLLEEGDRLFRIDPSQYEIALAKARSDLENAERQVEAGDAGVAAARAQHRAALASLDKSEKDTARLTRLRKQDPGTISARRLEMSEASLDAARARVAAAEAGIRSAIETKGGDEGADQNTILKVARTAVEKAELDLERTVVTATSPGVVTDLRADIGIYAGAGSPVMTLVSLRDVWVRAEFTENNLGRIRPGTPVEIVFDIMPGRVFDGEISNVGLGVSTSKAPPPGTLPTIENDRDWLRQSQRFPVNVEFDMSQDAELERLVRIGGQATVVAYGDGAGVLTWLGKIYIRLASLFSYAY